MALVCGVMFFSIDTGLRLNVSSSISANTGIAFHIKIDVAEALIDHGLTITSSPGSIPIEPNAVIKPDVLEFTVTAC